MSATVPSDVQHGATGVLGVLTRAYQADPDPILAEAVATAAAWIANRVESETRVLSGLYFGRSGTAWALLDAGTALGDEKLVRRATGLARRIPTSWPNPDICHGLAGAGLTQLHLWEVTGEVVFLTRARQAADTLAASAVRLDDGGVRWPVPDEFASRLAGLVHYGFTHGVAGVGAFLLAAGRAGGDRRHLDLARRAADTLDVLARRDDGGASGRAETTADRERCTGAAVPPESYLPRADMAWRRALSRHRRAGRRGGIPRTVGVRGRPNAMDLPVTGSSCSIWRRRPAISGTRSGLRSSR